MTLLSPLLTDLTDALGPTHVLTGADTAPYATDWTGKYPSDPTAVIRPADTGQVAQAVKIITRHGAQIVPLGGNTGLTGAAQAKGQIMISLERLNAIDIKPDASLAIVGAGAILQQVHDAADPEGLIFPLTFGARGSARIGGCLSTNAGGSNVLRYGSTRGLCLGLEVVLASGEVLDMMTELHKDNSGYDLRDLFIGAEGTLGIITRAVLRLFPKPSSYATALVACPDLPAGIALLDRLKRASGGAVEACEYMPDNYMQRLAQFRPDLRQPFAEIPPCTLMVELGATSGDLGAVLEHTLADAAEAGLVTDAVIAQNDTQRAYIWDCREAAAEITFNQQPFVNVDVCLPLDRLPAFFDTVAQALAHLSPGYTELTVAHLGDGNIHYTVYPVDKSPAHLTAIQDTIDAVTVSLGGSISAEHGVGQSKLSTITAHKDPVALAVMRSVKQALDPQGVMNPGKVLPVA